MKINLFDRYDIRTRICAFIFVVSPFLLDAYILVDAIRNFSSTVIVSVVLIAGSGLATCWMRYMGNSVKQEDLITEYLTPNSTVIDDNTKTRYYTKLIGIEPSFADLRNNDVQVSQMAAKAVSGWLKEKTRGENGTVSACGQLCKIFDGGAFWRGCRVSWRETIFLAYLCG